VRRGLVAASAAVVLLAACDRHDDNDPSPTPSASGSITVTSAPSPSPERAAALQMRPVQAVVPPSDPSYARATVTCGGEDGRPCTAAELTQASKLVLTDGDGIRYRLGPVVLDGNDVANATAIRSPFGGEWAVDYELTTDGADRFARATQRTVSLPSPRDSIAIVVDGLVVSAPTIGAVISSGRAEITGRFTETEAKALAAQIGGSVT
jgi:preprotein translocase subunit SecD